MPHLTVTDPTKRVTDPVLKSHLARQGVDWEGVEFHQDYASRSLGKEHSPYAKFYHDLNSRRRFMVVSDLPMVDCDGVKCEPRWVQTGNTYHQKNNVFTALVNDIPGRITLTCKNDQPDSRKKNDRLVYNPQIFLNGVEIPRPTAILLFIDPINENYLENTLEWDYGVCKRRLRTVEGRIHGYWIFASNPNADVLIRYNQTGDYRLKLGEFKVNEDEELIPASVFASATYPFEVSDSATYYPDADPETTSVDGYVARFDVPEETWATIIAGAGNLAGPSSTYITNQIGSGTTSNLWRRCWRGILLYDSSGLPDTAVISAATVSLYGNAGGTYDNLSISPTANIYTSTPNSNTDVIISDYGQIQAVAQSDTEITYAGFTTTDYNHWVLNTIGIGNVSLTGVSKFGYREASYDVTGTPPAWSSALQSGMSVFQSEQGDGYKPKLVVTYTVPEDFPQSASVSLGMTNTVSKLASFTRSISISLGLATTTSRLVNFPRTASNQFGTGLNISRAITVNRSSSTAIGLVSSSSKDFGKFISTILGMAVSGLRSITVNRTSSLPMGLAVTTSRLANLSRTASHALGLAVIASRIASFPRTVSNQLGLAITASRAIRISRSVSTSLGLALSVSRSIIISRAASLSLGLALTVSRARTVARSATNQLGLALTVSRSWGRYRIASVTMGFVSWFGHILKQRRKIATIGTNRELSAIGTNRDVASIGENREIEEW